MEDFEARKSMQTLPVTSLGPLLHGFSMVVAVRRPGALT
jgi:hypothetical protein